MMKIANLQRGLRASTGILRNGSLQSHVPFPKPNLYNLHKSFSTTLQTRSHSGSDVQLALRKHRLRSAAATKVRALATELESYEHERSVSQNPDMGKDMEYLIEKDEKLYRKEMGKHLQYMSEQMGLNPRWKMDYPEMEKVIRTRVNLEIALAAMGVAFFTSCGIVVVKLVLLLE